MRVECVQLGVWHIGEVEPVCELTCVRVVLMCSRDTWYVIRQALI